jgi:FkbM family methyltransferase
MLWRLIIAQTRALGISVNPPMDPTPHGALAPGRFDRAVIAATSRLPDNWLGLRLAILLRRLVTMRLPADALDVERWGLRLRLHPRDNGCEKNLLFTPQMYEPVELGELARGIAVARGDGRPFVFIDVGANVGLFSLFVAAQSGSDARILAIEPESGNFERLQFNLAANPGLPIEPVPLALGEGEGEVVVEINARDRGGTRTRRATAADPVRVPCRPLLAMLRERGIERIDALKIDVEGAEDKVLAPFFRDAPRSLWPGLILLEDTSVLWGVDLFALLDRCGYRAAARTRLNVVLTLA